MSPNRPRPSQLKAQVLERFVLILKCYDLEKRSFNFVHVYYFKSCIALILAQKLKQVCLMVLSCIEFVRGVLRAFLKRKMDVIMWNQ